MDADDPWDPDRGDVDRGWYGFFKSSEFGRDLAVAGFALLIIGLFLLYGGYHTDAAAALTLAILGILSGVLVHIQKRRELT
jgi:hypothetical protein